MTSRRVSSEVRRDEGQCGAYNTILALLVYYSQYYPA